MSSKANIILSFTAPLKSFLFPKTNPFVIKPKRSESNKSLLYHSPSQRFQHIINLNGKQLRTENQVIFCAMRHHSYYYHYQEPITPIADLSNRKKSEGQPTTTSEITALFNTTQTHTLSRKLLQSFPYQHALIGISHICMHSNRANYAYIYMERGE